MSETVLELRNITRTFSQGGRSLEVLRGCSIKINAGDPVAMIGPSGSGKSTLLQIAGLLERATSGQVIVNGRDTSSLDDGGRTALRRQSIGFVYQAHHLLPEFSAAENIMLPQMIKGISRSVAMKRAEELLAMVELTNRADHRPARLSGGEQQRVALARALANAPKILIADEPTGNLDPHTADHVFAILQNLIATQKLAVLMATHNHDLAKRMKRVVEIREGVLVVS